ncbi:MAG TPA: SIR2 family protein, partial [Pseudomonadales bacterium]|nr:SIR2 family protein [Pseudomonadales bacterium]
MTNQTHTMLNDIVQGKIIPYLGPGVLKYVTEIQTGAAMPADSDSLIYGMTAGQAMSPRLMYEFPRAAMHLENKKGRKFIEHYLTKTYAERQWHASAFHHWLASLQLPYLIDINRDSLLISLYKDREHILVIGAARLTGSHYRYDLYHFCNDQYTQLDPALMTNELPVLFKPYGAALPKASFIASDADFVDYITELMGGFAIPPFLKSYRQGKQYLFLGMRFNRDTEHMVMSEISFAASDQGSWAMIPSPTDKELRFCQHKNIKILSEDWDETLFPVKTNEV